MGTNYTILFDTSTSGMSFGDYIIAKDEFVDDIVNKAKEWSPIYTGLTLESAKNKIAVIVDSLRSFNARYCN